MATRLRRGNDKKKLSSSAGRDGINRPETERWNIKPDSLDSTVRGENVKDVEFLSCIKEGGWRLPVSG